MHVALWCARTDAADDEHLLAALALLPAARAELDQLEAALLFTARAAGLSWQRISRGLRWRPPRRRSSGSTGPPAAWTPEVAHRSDPADLALHGVRVLGSPTTARIAARFGIGRDTRRGRAARPRGTGWVRTLTSGAARAGR